MCVSLTLYPHFAFCVACVSWWCSCNRIHDFLLQGRYEGYVTIGLNYGWTEQSTQINFQYEWRKSVFGQYEYYDLADRKVKHKLKSTQIWPSVVLPIVHKTTIHTLINPDDPTKINTVEQKTEQVEVQIGCKTQDFPNEDRTKEVAQSIPAILLPTHYHGYLWWIVERKPRTAWLDFPAIHLGK